MPKTEVQTSDISAIAEGSRRPWLLTVILCIALVAVTLGVYWQSFGFQLTDLDDTFYVVRNPAVKAGLTAEGFKWAFTTFTQLNWHPLTWLSLMTDAQISKWAIDWSDESPPGMIFHVTNVIFHVLNVLLLFWLVSWVTGFRWRSAFVAALFAIHPMHVESVAWVTERKDVLSTFFWLLTTLSYVAYTRHARSVASVSRPVSGPARVSRRRNRKQPRRSESSIQTAGGSPRGIVYYALTVIFLALGLMAKPMLVTLPIVLLLMDIWPLRRIDFSGGIDSRAVWRLVREKIPFFALVIASVYVTILAEHSQGGVVPFDALPFGVRLANAAVAVVSYLVKMVWPTKMSCMYPHPGESIPVWMVIGSVVGLAAVTFFSVRQVRRRPYLTAGWLWYLVTLVPVCGIMQVGRQAMADRYTYVPYIGVFLIIAWAIPELLSRGGRVAAVMTGAAAGAAIVVLAVIAYGQTGYWHDSIVLNRHAVEVTKDNFVAHNNLGFALSEVQDYEGAIEEFNTALAIDPSYMDAHYNLGTLYGMLGRFPEAEEHLLTVVRAKAGIPGNRRYINAQMNLGSLYLRTRRPELAIQCFRAALDADPTNEKAAAALRMMGVAPTQRAW